MGGGFRREENIHSRLRHLAKRLDNGGTDIKAGRKIDDSVIADDLDIVGDPDTASFQIIDDASGKTVGVTEDAVKIETAVMKMFRQEAVDTQRSSYSVPVRRQASSKPGPRRSASL